MVSTNVNKVESTQAVMGLWYSMCVEGNVTYIKLII